MADARASSGEESRRVAEQARPETWEGRGFLRDLFLGRLSLDLVHPFPIRTKDRPEFTRFMEELRAFLREHVDPVAIDRTGEYPPEVLDGLRRLGAFGMKIPREYGGLGFTVSEYCRAMELVGSHDGSVDRGAVRPPVDRRAAAAQALRHRGAEDEVPATLRRGRHLRLRAHRAAGGLRPGEPADHRREAPRAATSC